MLLLLGYEYISYILFLLLFSLVGKGTSTLGSYEAFTSENTRGGIKEISDVWLPLRTRKVSSFWLVGFNLFLWINGLGISFQYIGGKTGHSSPYLNYQISNYRWDLMTMNYLQLIQPGILETGKNRASSPLKTISMTPRMRLKLNETTLSLLIVSLFLYNLFTL